MSVGVPRLVFQSCLPALLKQRTATSSPSSLVTKMRSPQMAGVELPMPGKGAVQAMLLVALQALYQLYFPFAMLDCFGDVALKFAPERVSFRADNRQVVLRQLVEDFFEAFKVALGPRATVLFIQPEVDFLADIIKLAPDVP